MADPNLHYRRTRPWRRQTAERAPVVAIKVIREIKGTEGTAWAPALAVELVEADLVAKKEEETMALAKVATVQVRAAAAQEEEEREARKATVQVTMVRAEALGVPEAEVWEKEMTTEPEAVSLISSFAFPQM